MQEVVLSQLPRPEIYSLPAASLVALGEYKATAPALVSEQAVGRHGVQRRFQQKRGRMSIFFDDGGPNTSGASLGTTGWWIGDEDCFGETCLLWCPGSSEQIPETGWQWQGYLGYYEVDLHVSPNMRAEEMEPHSLIFAGNLFLDVLGQSMVCCLKGAELLLHEFTAKMAVDSKDVPLNSIGGAVPAESQPALELSALPPPAPAAAAPAPVLARAHEPAPEVVAIFPAPREDVEVKVEEREEHQIEEVSLEELTEEARRAKDNFVESFKAHLSRFSPEEEAQNEADLAKEHFLEAFCKKGAPQEQLKRRQVAEEVLQRQELQELLMSQHRHKVSHELRGEREIQEARMDQVLEQVRALQMDLREALDARQATELEKLDLMESHRLHLEELRQVNLEGGEDLQSKCAELEAENAECKVKLSQAATALWSHEAALQEALQDASTLRSELLNTSAAEEEIALLREELAQLRSNESTAEASTAEAEQQMQTLAEEYQHALADIGSLRAIYDSEIEQLQLELQQCRETHEQDVASLQDELQIARDQQESAKKAQSLQDVLSKRVVQLEAKLSQQTLEHEAMVEELEKLRPQAAATAAAEERASSAEEVLATTARNFQAAEARQLQAEEMVRTLKLRCQSLEAQVQKRAENPNVPRSDHAIAIKATKPVARSDQPQFSALPGRRPLARVEGPLVAMASALSPTAPNTPLLETRKVLAQRPQA
ncbi:unnamed protein product [Durusdinium trenchii]|uniref:Uncharacterized protein n=1 Tax=Durusdinium trenchii TaxID=1381693 RepID=A0ABP0QQI6_9DINO